MATRPETMLFIPPWSIVHSRIYKAQLPYFSERFRCITYDGRGNGKSDRPDDVAAYSLDNYLADALAVMDALDVEQAILVGLSFGGLLASILAAHHPERVRAAILAGTITTIGPPHYARFDAAHFTAKRDSYEGWDKFNHRYWLKNYPDFAEFFIRNIFNEPHSTKQIEDGIGWAVETNGPTLLKTVEARAILPAVRRQRGDVPQDPLSGAVHPRRQRPDPAPRARGGRARRGERLGVRHDRRRRS